MAIYRGIGGSGDATNDAAVNQIADLTTQAVASAAAALASEIATAADEVLTNQDTIDTAADLVLTNADVVLTHADVVLTAADAASTAADVLLTNADVVTTNANAATTTQDAIDTAADAAATAADLVQTNLDQIATTADAASTAADALATAADKVATNADVVLTHADVVLTNADAAATALALDEFTDTYLGAKASAPTLDNDGNALIDGALYFDTTINALKVYDLGNTVWVGIANYVHPDHTGDVTSTGDGATVIANNVVTNAKSADVGTSTIKGRIDAGTGDPQDLTPANVRTIINVEDGSTADQTKADIDALGINAATLDSLTRFQFLRSDAGDTMTGALTFDTGVSSVQTKSANSTTTDEMATSLWTASGKFWQFRPYPAGAGDNTKDFGYDFTASYWKFDESPYVGTNAVLDSSTGLELTGGTLTGSLIELGGNETVMNSFENTDTTNAVKVRWKNSGETFNFEPYPNGVLDTTKTFSYNFFVNYWKFQESPYVGANAVLDDGDLGVTVQGYDVDTTKDDVTSARSANLIFNDNVYLKLGTSSETTFRSNGTNSYMNLVNTASDFYIQSAAVNKFLFDGSSGNFHADGDVIAASTSVGSDRKIKKDIRPIEDASSKLDSLVGVQYNLKKSGKADAGLIAQDVQSVLPEAVKEVAFLDGEEGETYLSLNYNAVIGLLVAGFQEEKAKVLELEKRILELEK